MNVMEHSEPDPPLTFHEAAESIKAGCDWLAGRIGALEAERDIARQQLRGAVSENERLRNEITVLRRFARKS